MHKAAVSIFALTALCFTAAAPVAAQGVRDPADGYGQADDAKDRRIHELERKVIALQDQIIALQTRLLASGSPQSAPDDPTAESEGTAQLKARIAALESEVQYLRYERAQAAAAADSREPRRGTAAHALNELKDQFDTRRGHVISPDAPAVPKATVTDSRIAAADYPMGTLRREGKMSYITVGDGPGAIKVSSPNIKGGKVHLDGKELGYAPLVIEGVVPGVHRVEIKIDGAARRTKILRVKGEREVKRLVMY